MPQLPEKLDPAQLTPRDLRRARVVLGGRNPWELLDDPLDAVTLCVWALRSRTDPNFTWEQAEDTPLGEFTLPDDDMADEAGSPLPATPSTNGSPRRKRNSTGAKASRTSAGSTG